MLSDTLMKGNDNSVGSVGKTAARNLAPASFTVNVLYKEKFTIVNDAAPVRNSSTPTNHG